MAKYQKEPQRRLELPESGQASNVYASPVPRRHQLVVPMASSTFPPQSPFSRFLQELSPLPCPTVARETVAEMLVFRTPQKPSLPLSNTIYDSICQPLNFSPLGSSNRIPEVRQSSEAEGDSQSSSPSRESMEKLEPEPPKPIQKLKLAPPRVEVTPKQPQKTPTEHKVLSEGSMCCNCKKSRCLKLYCDCFRNNKVCEGCNCVACLNTPDHEDERESAMLALIERNPQAFKPKIQIEKHSKGCNCKKSNCLKKYCECYQAGLKCTDLCRCEDCKNNKQRQPKKMRLTAKKQARYSEYSRRYGAQT